MKPTSVLIPSLLLLTCGALTAQETPKPAPELQKYAPLIGSWKGSGTAMMSGPEASKWESHTTYSWALGNFFVEEQTIVTFSDMPKPLIMRGYLGWDAENQRYVSVGTSNDGETAVNRVDWASDGSMAVLANKFHEGQTFLERYRHKITGDSMTFSISMMGADGEAMTPVTGTMKKVDKPVAIALNASSFTATPAAGMAQIVKSAGTFDVKAKMIMMPGTPSMNITGQDVVTPLFDGTIVHVKSTGVAEGMPGEYEGHLFYGWSARENCLLGVMVSNMGEVGEMRGTWTKDGKQLVLTSSARWMGEPCATRMIMDVDANGAPSKAVGHCLYGTHAPYECWSATYTKK